MKRYLCCLLWCLACGLIGVEVRQSKELTDFCGEGWELLSTTSHGASVTAATEDGIRVLKLRAPRNSWTVLRTERKDLSVGEVVELEVVFKSTAPNIVSIITSGFLWGGDPAGADTSIAKRLVNGQGQWQTVRFSHRLTSAKVSIGMGMEKNAYPVELLLKSIRIRRAREIAADHRARLLANPVHPGLPPEIRAEVDAMRRRLADANARPVEEQLTELANYEKIMTRAAGKLFPATMNATESGSELELFNTAFPHSVWCRVVHAPEVTVRQELAGRRVPLVEADLVLIPAGGRVQLWLQAPPGTHEITLQPLDFLMEKTIKTHISLNVK